MALGAPQGHCVSIIQLDNLGTRANPRRFLQCCGKHGPLPWTSADITLRVERPSSVYTKYKHPMLCAAQADSLDGKNDSPWEGAVIYKRDPTQTHLEFCTTLERLGMSNVSSEVSKSTASSMGIRVTRAVTDYPSGTPVQISLDVSRKKRDLKLDGIIRTFITLLCARCGEPAAHRVFSNFCLLLTEQPVKTRTQMTYRIVLGEDKPKISDDENDEEEDELGIDLDDQLHFSLEEKEIDISKYIRDTVHLEIAINAVCDVKCKGLCLKCGANLNKSICNCAKQKEEIVSGPFQKLRKKNAGTMRLLKRLM